MTHTTLTYWAALWLTVSLKATVIYALGGIAGLLLSHHRPAWRAFIWLGVILSFGWLTILEATSHTAPFLAAFLPPSDTALSIAVQAYGLGAFLLVAFVAHSAIRLSLLRAYASPLPVDLTVPDAAAAGTAAQLLKRVRLYSSGQIATPTSFGILRPSIALPPAPAGSIYRHIMQAGLVFQLIVVLRFDALWTLLARLVQCLYFPHPFVWLAHRHLCRAREQTCDRWTARATADASGYEMDLLTLANAAQSKAAFMSLDTPMIQAGPAAVRQRIARLQSDDRPQSVPVWPGIAALTGGMIVLALLAAVGGTATAPTLATRPLVVGLFAALFLGIALTIIATACGTREPRLLPPVDGLVGRSRYTLAECVERLARDLQDLQLILGTAVQRWGPLLLVAGILAATIIVWILGWIGSTPTGWPRR